MIPIIYAAIVFSWQGALGAYLLALVSVLPIITVFRSMNSLITNLVLLLLPVLITSIVVYEMTWRRKERENFAEREAERRAYIHRPIKN